MHHKSGLEFFFSQRMSHGSFFLLSTSIITFPCLPWHWINGQTKTEKLGHLFPRPILAFDRIFERWRKATSMQQVKRRIVSKKNNVPQGECWRNVEKIGNQGKRWSSFCSRKATWVWGVSSSASFSHQMVSSRSTRYHWTRTLGVEWKILATKLDQLPRHLLVPWMRFATVLLFYSMGFFSLFVCFFYIRCLFLFFRVTSIHQ